MTIAWEVTHLSDQTLYSYSSGNEFAEILGADKHWVWRAARWAGDGWQATAQQMGEAVSAASAKDDVKRWFADALEHTALL